MSTQFVKGKSGNPSGISSEARALIQRGRTECARQIPSLIKELGDMDMIYLCSQDLNAIKVRVTIIKELLDRGMGKALQAHTFDDSSDGMDPAHMTKAQIEKMIEGNFFGAVQDMIETKNERFMELVNKANAEQHASQPNKSDSADNNATNTESDKVAEVDVDVPEIEAPKNQKRDNKTAKKKDSHTHQQ